MTTRISDWRTVVPVCCPWQIPVPTQTAHSFSSAPPRQTGWTISMWYSAGSSTAWRWCARSSYVVLRMVEPRNVWRSMTAVSWSERVWAGALHERERSTGTGRAGVWPFAAWRVGDRAGSAVATWRALLTRFLRKCTEIAALYRTAPRAPLRACGCGAQRRLVV